MVRTRTESTWASEAIRNAVSILTSHDRPRRTLTRDNYWNCERRSETRFGHPILDWRRMGSGCEPFSENVARWSERTGDRNSALNSTVGSSAASMASISASMLAPKLICSIGSTTAIEDSLVLMGNARASVAGASLRRDEPAR